MYIFSVKRNLVPIVEITVDDDTIKKNVYLENLIEKCFERVFQIIREENRKEEVDFSEEVDLEEDD